MEDIKTNSSLRLVEDYLLDSCARAPSSQYQGLFEGTDSQNVHVIFWLRQRPKFKLHCFVY